MVDELNIKKLTLSTDKEKYGVKLRAEPDHKTLGARLKGAFKVVTKEIQALSDAQLTDFVATNTIEVMGHTLGPDDIRIMYSFDGNNDKYEAHSEGDMLVLLDCTPDQEFVLPISIHNFLEVTIELLLMTNSEFQAFLLLNQSLTMIIS